MAPFPLSLSPRLNGLGKLPFSHFHGNVLCAHSLERSGFEWTDASNRRHTMRPMASRRRFLSSPLHRRFHRSSVGHDSPVFVTGRPIGDD
jgi:hypothetical protein